MFSASNMRRTTNAICFNAKDFNTFLIKRHSVFTVNIACVNLFNVTKNSFDRSRNLFAIRNSFFDQESKQYYSNRAIVCLLLCEFLLR